MDVGWEFWVELLVVIGAIVMGVRMGGIGLGIWGVVGVAILVWVFGLAPGSPPGSAMLIIIAVITAASAMQVAGGIDYLVLLATKLIRRNPKRINIIAPLVSWGFTLGAGTSNIFYPLLPVIYETAYENGIRPERPLATSTVANVYGITCSPVSAAMAAMLTLTDVSEYGNFSLGKILLITIPASLVAIVAMSIIQGFIGKDLADDPVYQERLKAGQIKPPSAGGDEPEKPLPQRAALAAYLFLVGVVVIVLTSAVPALAKMVPGPEGEMVEVDSTTIIQMTMFLVALLIIVLCKIDPVEITKQQVFGAGIIALIALFGVAWLADTFIASYTEEISSAMSDWVTAVPVSFAIAIFLFAMMTTSQSATTRTLVPIGLTVLGVAQVVAMWQALSGVLFLPANGTQLAAVAVDETGSTKIGKAVVNHSFMIPLLISTVIAVLVGLVIAAFV
jgi:anaerobic C4-dicarboxylate transporter DcuA/anaerobic C4-dicarboxylate transporter DcuB